MDSNCRVAGCTLGERWWECAVELQGTRGVAAQRKDAQPKGRELAAKLTPGTFIAVQDRENQNHAVPFLVGITRDAGDGTCIAERVKGRKWIEGTQCGAMVRGHTWDPVLNAMAGLTGSRRTASTEHSS